MGINRLSMKQRTSPIVWDGTGPLDSVRLQAYEQAGFLLLPELLGPSTIATLQTEAEALAQQAGASTIYERDGKTVRSVFDAHNLSSVILQTVIENKFIIDVAEQILGHGLYVHQCHVNFKRPHAGGEFFWHSDFTFWYWEDGMRDPRAISILIFLDEQRSETGPLFLVPGSHRWITHDAWYREVADHNSAVKHDLVGDPTINGLVNLEMLRTLAEQHPIDTVWAKQGDVLFMDGNLVHASGPNLGCESRRILLLILNSLENQLGVPPSGQAHRPEYISARSFNRLR
jgi:ectoine hydroxylase